MQKRATAFFIILLFLASCVSAFSFSDFFGGKITGNVITNQNNCKGCYFNNTCLPIGYRLLVNSTNSYCDISGILPQKTEGCQNDYECESNTCSSGKCNSITGVRKIFVEIICRITNLFSGEDTYNLCVEEKTGLVIVPNKEETFTISGNEITAPNGGLKVGMQVSMVNEVGDIYEVLIKSVDEEGKKGTIRSFSLPGGILMGVGEKNKRECVEDKDCAGWYPSAFLGFDEGCYKKICKKVYHYDLDGEPKIEKHCYAHYSLDDGDLSYDIFAHKPCYKQELNLVGECSQGKCRTECKNYEDPKFDIVYGDISCIGKKYNSVCMDEYSRMGTCKFSGEYCWCSVNCGNGQVDSDEDCDGENLNGGTCEGLVGDEYIGSVKCDSNCKYDTSDCIIEEKVFCGDGSCNGDETCSSCSVDCGGCPPLAFCGDGICNNGEDYASCTQDCPYVPPCDSTCYSCGVNNACGEYCGDCITTPSCGDGSCNGAEAIDSCSVDCGTDYCGNGYCGSTEDCSICATDCGNIWNLGCTF
jgi:hypothetical protein